MDNLLASVYQNALLFVAGLFPSSNGFSFDITSAIAQVMVMGKQLSFAINYPVIFGCLYAYILLEVGIFTVKTIMWIIKLIRG